VHRVILPRENEPDLAELPPEARKQLQFVLADTIEDVLVAAFDGAGARRPRAPRARPGATAERRAARTAKTA
jgi:ATP-dependent Lon protease